MRQSQSPVLPSLRALPYCFRPRPSRLTPEQHALMPLPCPLLLTLRSLPFQATFLFSMSPYVASSQTQLCRACRPRPMQTPFPNCNSLWLSPPNFIPSPILPLCPPIGHLLQTSNSADCCACRPWPMLAPFPSCSPWLPTTRACWPPRRARRQRTGRMGSPQRCEGGQVGLEEVSHNGLRTTQGPPGRTCMKAEHAQGNMHT